MAHSEEYLTGKLAESRTWTDPLTLSFAVRRGVMWTGNADIGFEPREFTAADAARSLTRNVDNGSMHFETATLVEHRTGVPIASLNYHDDGGEIAAVGALLEEVPIAGAVITIDALHTTLDTAASIVEKHAADYLMTVKQNAPETFQALVTMPWELAAGRFSEDPEKGHGRIDRRHIEVLTPLPPSPIRMSPRCSACAASAPT